MPETTETPVGEGLQAEFRPCLDFQTKTLGRAIAMDPVGVATAFREKLKELEAIARDFTDYIKTTDLAVFDKGESIAQSIIAMRHIEDARMRF